jgi:hypothetical protein
MITYMSDHPLNTNVPLKVRKLCGRVLSGNKEYNEWSSEINCWKYLFSSTLEVFNEMK